MRPAATRVPWPILHSAACVIAIALAFIPLRSASSQCIENSLWGCVDIWYGFSTAPGAALNWGEEPVISWAAGEECPLGCYDLRSGLIEIKAWGAPWGQQCGATICAGDRFQVVGVSGSDPLQFAAEFWVDGVVNGPDVAVSAVLREPSDPTGASDRVTDGPVQMRMKVPLFHAPGEEFAVYFSLEAGAAGLSGDAHAAGTLRFSGLPPGAYVISCQGYDLPVPAIPTSWGQVKALYR